jgi:hypothetical protein
LQGSDEEAARGDGAGAVGLSPTRQLLLVAANAERVRAELLPRLGALLRRHYPAFPAADMLASLAALAQALHAHILLRYRRSVAAHLRSLLRRYRKGRSLHS